MSEYIAQDPVISVLMSVFNGALWLDESIKSVLDQTFKEFEFIIVDDGSTDESLEIIKRYARSDNRFVIIEKGNTGLADSLNCGIRIARGQWIARLDADDICMPDRLHLLYKYVESDPDLVLVGTDFIEIDEAGISLKKQCYPSAHSRLVRNLERHKRFFPHSSAFIRTDIARQIGGYNVRIVRSQDHDFWLRLSDKGVVGCLNRPLVKIRKHGAQISNEESGMKQVYYDFTATICHFLRSNRQVDPSVEMSDVEWNAFFEWVRHEVDNDIDFIRKRKVWKNAHSLLLNEGKGISLYISLFREVLVSGYAYELFKEKFIGTFLPERLAGKWTATSEKIELV